MSEVNMPLFDAHLDLAWNALFYRRDLTLPLNTLRAIDRILNPHGKDTPVVSLPAMHDAQITHFVGTIFTRWRAPTDTHFITEHDFIHSTQAAADGYAQCAYYLALEKAGKLSIVRTANDLDNATSEKPACLIMIEGCDPVTEPNDIARWHAQGVRMASLVHTGTNAYATGTGEEGEITAAGFKLLHNMASLGMVLDLSHLCDRSLAQAVDAYGGPICATHSNPRAFVSGNRHLTDEQIKTIAQRGGVIGLVCYNAFLDPNWPNHRDRKHVSLARIADMIDHICQLVGNTQHVGIGSDLDGGFGLEAMPHEMQSIAQLANLAPLLTDRGYNEQDVQNILRGNWQTFFANALMQA